MKMSWRYAVSAPSTTSTYYGSYGNLGNYGSYRNNSGSRSSSSYYSIPRYSSDRVYAKPSRMEVSDKTTGLHLQRILHYSVAPCRPLPGSRSAECAIHDVDCDEVYPGIFIGDAASARNKVFLRIMGITHVLNTAEGSRYGQVDTGHIYYRDMPNIRYMGFPMMDQPTTDISRYFYIASKFIENSINSGGKVLVHCLVGMSRSATCVLAHLMIVKKMTAVEAIRTVRVRRDIRPNDGFLQQLADLDNELKRERNYSSY